MKPYAVCTPGAYVAHVNATDVSVTVMTSKSLASTCHDLESDWVSPRPDVTYSRPYAPEVFATAIELAARVATER